MKEKKGDRPPKKVIIAPTEPIFRAVVGAGKGSGAEERIGLFRYCPLPLCGEGAAVAGPALGAPAAALLMEGLATAGAKTVLLFSVCGALAAGPKIGDFFLPTGGISEEGTSRLYREGPVPPPSEGLLERIRTACRGRRVQEGIIWTTDAPARETPEKIIRYGKKGASAVDMEFTALAVVADLYGITFGALMVVSDEPRPEGRRIGFRTPEFRQGLKAGARIAVEILSSQVHPAS